MSDTTPQQQPETQPLEVHVDWPDAPETTLRLSAGACRLRLRPGTPQALVDGSYDDPTGTLPLSVTTEHGEVRISQHTRLSEVRRIKAAVPTLDLALGTGRAFALSLATGASDVQLELGSLSLRRLSVRMGAGSADIAFSSPCVGELTRLECEAGAASIALRGLGFASPERLVVVGGAASYDLSFDGPLRHDVSARVTTAGASVTVRVPAATAARIGVVSVLAGLTVRDGFQTWEDSYWTQAGVDGAHPLLSLDTSVTLGSLELEVDNGGDIAPAEIESG
jgi:hypothetical protein